MNPREKKELIRKCLLVLAIIGVIGSSGYLIYDLVWLPYSIQKQNEIFNVDEEQSNTSQNESSQNEGTPPVQEKYVQIKSQYEDFAGKLIVKGLKMDFPVVQGEDNSYYLKYNIDGEEDKHGALFVDYRNDLVNLNQNTIIFGHNMRDGTQFGMLSMYKKLSTYKACPVITFNTIYKDYKWKVFAAFLINTQPEHDGGYVFNYLRTDFATDREFYDFYDEVMERSYFITDTDVTPEDKILTLSTCSLLLDDSRFVVMARLVRDGEEPSVDTSAARVNTNQRFPQAWYDENNQTNPYID
ncbi:MAG: class B sortase [Clostridia bacterium]|nr:class B sortase [Clostridia bacterium]